MNIPRLTLATIAAAVIPERYSPIDETRDFRQALLDSPAGVRVLAILAHRCGWLTATVPVSAAAVDVPHLAAYNEGRRSVIAEIAGVLDRSTDQPQQVNDASGRDDN